MLTSRKFYTEIVQKVKVKATSVKYFEKILAPQEEDDWEQVYMLPRKSTIESNFPIQNPSQCSFLNAELLRCILLIPHYVGFVRKRMKHPFIYLANV